MIMEDEEFESNFSSKYSLQLRQEAKISDSDWDSRLGGSEQGYDMNKIKWNDLGRKYIIKKGKKSMIADYNSESMQELSYFHTTNGAALNQQQEPRTLLLTDNNDCSKGNLGLRRGISSMLKTTGLNLQQQSIANLDTHIVGYGIRPLELVQQH